MLDIVKMSEELRAKLQREADDLINDRLTMRDVLEARSRELAEKRDTELARVDEWASEQRKLIQEIFSALLLETELDRLKNDESLQNLIGDSAAQPAPSTEPAIPTHVPAKSAQRTHRHLKAAQ